MASPNPTLNFISLNPKASQSLLLLHGAFSSHHEWDLVTHTPHLSSYHILIPDLPSHGTSTSQSLPFALPSTARLLADLIITHAKNSKAGIVGLSLGGYTALYLASKFPDVIDHRLGLFVSGCGRPWPAPGSVMTWASGVFMGLANWITMHLPKGVYGWLIERFGMAVVEELYVDVKAVDSFAIGRAVASELAEDVGVRDRNWKGLSEGVGVRTCVVAGVLDDGEEDCRERGRQLRVGNADSRAFMVEKRHAWDIQDPELFARGIKCWIEGGEMPEGYVSLD